MLEDGFVDSDGVRLHYIDWGGTGRPLLLLAGLGGTAHLFRGLAPRLRDRFRVLGLTRRGHGRSDRPDSGYHLETLVGDIRNFLDAQEIEQAVLVGHSFAGLEMPLFAIRHPERVEAIVYLDGLNPNLEPAPDPAKDPVWTVLERTPSDADLISPEAYLAYHKRSRPDLASVWCEAIEADKLEDMTIDGVRDPPAARARQRKVGPKLFEGLGQHAEPDYAAVSAPMLAIVLGGSSHPLMPPDASAELRRAANVYWVDEFVPRIQRRTQMFRDAVPDARVVELDTSNHPIFVAREDETVQAIFEFLERQVDGE